MNIITVALYLQILTKASIYPNVEKLFDKYKFHCWKFYKSTQLKELDFVAKSDIKTYIKYVKIICLLEYYQNLLENGTEILIQEHIKTTIEESILNSIEDDFINHIQIKDIESIEKFIYKKVEKQDEWDKYIYFLYLFEIELFQQTVFYTQVIELLPTFANKSYSAKEMYKLFPPVNEKLFNGFCQMLYKDYHNEMELIQTIWKSENKDLLHRVKSLELILSTYGLDIDTINESFPLNKLDLKNIARVHYNYELQEDKIFIYSMMIICSITKAYSEARNILINTNQDFVNLEQKAQKEYQRKDKLALEQYKYQLNQKNNEIETLRKEYRENIEREIIKKDKEIEDLKHTILQLTEMLNLMKNEQVDNYIIEEKQFNLEPFVNQKTIYVIGGYKQLIAKLKNYYPNLLEVQNNFNSLKTPAPIFLITRYTNHTVTNELNSNNIKYYYINSTGANSIAYEIKEILDSLDNIEEI